MTQSRSTLMKGGGKDGLACSTAEKSFIQLMMNIVVVQTLDPHVLNVETYCCHAMTEIDLHASLYIVVTVLRTGLLSVIYVFLCFSFCIWFCIYSGIHHFCF